MAYAVVRAEKLKTPAKMHALDAHNAQGRRVRGEHAERDRLARMESAGVQKVRSNAVLGVEFVLAASKGFFTGPERTREFFDRGIGWLDQRFGRENVCSIFEHTHETTPHLHAVVIPLVEKPLRGWVLDARSVIDGRAGLADMQTSFAAAVADLGLEPGKPSPDKHTPTRVFRAELADATARAEAAERAAVELRLKAINALRDTRAKTFAAREVLWSAQALMHSFDYGYADVDDAGRVRPTKKIDDAGLTKKFERLLTPTTDEGRAFVDWVGRLYKQARDQRERERPRPALDRGRER